MPSKKEIEIELNKLEEERQKDNEKKNILFYKLLKENYNSIFISLFYTLDVIYVLNDKLLKKFMQNNINKECEKIEVNELLSILPWNIDVSSKYKKLKIILDCLIESNHITVTPKTKYKYIYAGSDKIINLRKKTKKPIYFYIMPLRACIDIFKDYRTPTEIAFLIMRYISKKYRITYCSKTITIFKIFSNELNEKCRIIYRDQKKIQKDESIRLRIQLNDINNWLINILKNKDFAYSFSYISLFLDISVIIGIIEYDRYNARYLLINGKFDPHFILAKLYGLKTSIPGFDSLFSGGILLPCDYYISNYNIIAKNQFEAILKNNLLNKYDNNILQNSYFEKDNFFYLKKNIKNNIKSEINKIIPKTEVKQNDSEEKSGKIILICGEYGTGKTIFVCQLAFEIARKGGIAFIFSLDQNLIDLQQQFYTFGWLPGNKEFVFSENLSRFRSYACKGTGEKGLIGIGRISKTSIDDHFNAIEEFIKKGFFDNYPIRLIVIDPINAVIIPENTNTQELRNKTNTLFQFLKEKCITGIFTAENEIDPIRKFHHEQNIADYVIHFWSEEIHNIQYRQRFLEIGKSRGQLAHRGRQTFSIRKENGINIYPSSAALLIDRSNRIKEKLQHISYTAGLKDLDNIIVPNNPKNQSFKRGAIITYTGTSGTGKTELALLFLLSSDKKNKDKNSKDKKNDNSKSLFITFNETAKSIIELIKTGSLAPTILKEYNIGIAGTESPLSKLIILPFDGGFIRAGEFLQKIITKFKKARESGYIINRVVIDKLNYMEDNCPLLANDESFITALINILKTENCTSILIYTEAGNNTTKVEKEILEASEYVISFKKVFFKAQQLTALQVLKSFTNSHNHKIYELSVNIKDGIQITDQFSLIKNVMSNKPEVIPIRLFLHSEREEQVKYNEYIKASLQNTVITKIFLTKEDILLSLQMADIGTKSAFNELQIVQVDEPQLYFAKLHWLEKFPINNEILKTFKDETLHCCKNKELFWALPYYGNMSFLAYDSREITENEITDWASIAALCNKNEKEIFFDFPKISDENYNCLFIELLLADIIKNQKNSPLSQILIDTDFCFRDILIKKNSIYKTIKLFWQISHRSFIEDLENQQKAFQVQIRETVNMKAKVWRLWYTTLNQNFAIQDIKKAKFIKITALPSNISISGDWFLGVTKVSAAKDVGLEIIKVLTSSYSSQVRLEKGIGFPLQKIFFETETIKCPTYIFMINPQLIQKLYTNAFRRSKFGCYFVVSSYLTYYLKNILSIPTKTTFNEIITDILKLMRENLEKIFTKWSDTKEKNCELRCNHMCKY